MVTRQLQVRCRPGKVRGQRPTFCHWATLLTKITVYDLSCIFSLLANSITTGRNECVRSECSIDMLSLSEMWHASTVNHFVSKKQWWEVSRHCLVSRQYFHCLGLGSWGLLSRFLRASAMLKHVIDIGWTSVCPSVRPSHAGIVSKRLNILSCFLRHTIDHSF